MDGAPEVSMRDLVQYHTCYWRNDKIKPCADGHESDFKQEVSFRNYEGAAHLGARVQKYSTAKLGITLS